MNIDNRKIVIVLGPGGVGKTTLSATLAVRAALSGKRVALLSIDPAKRLADAMGLDLRGGMTRIELPEKSGGILEASMIDQKSVFDSMVTKHASSPEAAEKIMDHSLYQAASQKMSGPLEYMALARVLELVESGRYDLVVLDTPPDTHALDFLSRPNLLAGFTDSKVMSLLVKPFHMAGKFGFGKIMSFGERLMGGVSKVTGVHALKVLAEFFVLLQEVIDGFSASGTRMLELMKSEQCGFTLVSVPTHPAIRSSEFLASELSRMGFQLDHAFLNRCLGGLDVDACESISQILQKRLIGEQVCIHAFKNKLGQETQYSQVPEQYQHLHTVESLVNFSQILEDAVNSA